VGGATTVSLIADQLPEATELLRSRNADRNPRNDVEVVTLHIGGNDVTGPIIDACVTRPQGTVMPPSGRPSLRTRGTSTTSWTNSERRLDPRHRSCSGPTTTRSPPASSPRRQQRSRGSGADAAARPDGEHRGGVRRAHRRRARSRTWTTGSVTTTASTPSRRGTRSSRTRSSRRSDSVEQDRSRRAAMGTRSRVPSTSAPGPSRGTVASVRGPDPDREPGRP
jgi:hypothetical protein